MEEQSIYFLKYLRVTSKCESREDEEKIVRLKSMLETCTLVVDGLEIYDFKLFMVKYDRL